MRENNVRAYLMGKLEPWGLIRPIENDAGVGFPDVNFFFPRQHAEGWIEVKYVRERPKRVTTPVFGEVYKPSQRIWFRQRVTAGYRNVFTFIRLDDSFFLFDGPSFKLVETITEPEAVDLSIWYLRSIHQVDKSTWETLYNTIVYYCASLPRPQ